MHNLRWIQWTQVMRFRWCISKICGTFCTPQLQIGWVRWIICCQEINDCLQQKPRLGWYLTLLNPFFERLPGLLAAQAKLNTDADPKNASCIQAISCNLKIASICTYPASSSSAPKQCTCMDDFYDVFCALPSSHTLLQGAGGPRDDSSTNF